MMDRQDSDFDDDEGRKLHPFNPTKKKLDCDRQDSDVSPDTGPHAQESDGYKKPVKNQQSDSSQSKEDVKVMKKTTGFSPTDDMPHQDHPKNDSHNCQIRDLWDRMLEQCKDATTAEAPTGRKKDFSNTGAVPKNAPIRARMAADLGNCDGHRKMSQSKQNDGEKSQTSTRARAVGGRSSRAKPSNAGGDFDDDEGRKPHPFNPTKKKPALAIHPTGQNRQAVGKMLEDHGVQVHHNVNVSMPGRDAFNTQGIRHGKACDAINFAGHVERLKTRNPAELRGYHRGVLLDAETEGICHVTDLTPSQYREGEQYIVIKRLGKGFFGVACLLEDTFFVKQFVGKRVSVKDFVASEAVLWCPLEDSGIVRFLGLLLTDDWVMFLSSYQQDSRTLQKLIDQCVLDLGLALEIMQKLLVVVERLHSIHHIVHLDIKPDNILILPGDQVQLIDFGLARKQIAESQLYTMDIRGLGRTLECMMTSCRKLNNGISSRNMHPDVRRFIVQMINRELTAAQALKIIKDLRSTVDEHE